MVAFAVEADKVRRQESPNFVLEEIAIQSPGEPKAHLLGSRAGVRRSGASGIGTAQPSGEGGRWKITAR